MDEQGLHIAQLPENRPSILIAGFDGWGNALHVSKSMDSYLIRNLQAEKFAWINPEPFYRYDENRPQVNIEGGFLRGISPPGGSFYAANPDLTGDKGIVIFKASEPNLR